MSRLVLVFWSLSVALAIVISAVHHSPASTYIFSIAMVTLLSLSLTFRDRYKK